MCRIRVYFAQCMVRVKLGVGLWNVLATANGFDWSGFGKCGRNPTDEYFLLKLVYGLYVRHSRAGISSPLSFRVFNLGFLFCYFFFKFSLHLWNLTLYIRLHFRIFVCSQRTLHLHESDLACVRSSYRACELPLGKPVDLFHVSCNCVFPEWRVE
jgi:hypothetical protein